jgi:hypothetical protein
MDARAYQAFIERLSASLQQESDVVGLVLLGSTAGQSHLPDQWSDHDFFVITHPGVQEHFRTHYDWLPDHEQIVLTVRETEHGLKILYADGHLLEYAVFDVAEISVAKANDYLVVFDLGGVAEAMQKIAVANTEQPVPNLQQLQGMFLGQLVVGAGRVARGEVISGQVFIRTYALGQLLPLLAHVLEPAETGKLDNLDMYRRFEQAFPTVGREVNVALNSAPLQAAQKLLDLYETHCRHLPDYPVRAVATVRQFLKGL